ncbi:phosphoenolpyruvate-protein phosphotransferase [Stenotrophomonas ginsengisoli]|uniref:Phosphoenolpyruvate-protein phosphotransferase n=1 Tax=Stenotrophomonas ginsengisoli TaxID=336566 RepID=A0A0R0DBF0_9GAMM|nr:phosphoenolpyruvate--protein phosphotransferase [Stenotrophomonas ginsengisoli]KRG79179.1 phosphoenolpyruvate-protein phosphotransferase [Stenotrophomonas ginsengisoli]
MASRLAGLGASRGAALGRARVRQPLLPSVGRERIAANRVEEEVSRLHQAVDSARQEMASLRQRLQGAMPAEIGEFLDLHTLLLDDPELLAALDELIRSQRYSASCALGVQRQRLASLFEQMEDDYLRSRLDDLDHVIGRLLQLLNPQQRHSAGVAGEILVCESIAPAELVQLPASGVVGVVTTGGSLLSHSAILARSLHLPLVVGASNALQKLHSGQLLIIDGESGQITPDPDAGQLQQYRLRVRELARERRELQRLRSKPSRTLDGTDIRLLLNAESSEDFAQVHRLGAAGLGLYRTEFLFLQGRHLPDEQTQFEHYRDAVLAMAGRPATFRTIDLGADKADRAGLAPSHEDNPALGLRGIRLSMANPAVFDTQLRAILRASGYGPVRILLPMVSGREEVLAVRRRLRLIQRQLRDSGHAVSEQVALGAMIEVPAAALAVHGFIDLVDFLSVGTNDLVQYLLAADRNNPAVAGYYNPLHPSLLQLLAQLLDSASAAQVPVCVCGEIAGDARLVPLLLALGLRELSLHPSSLLEVRQAIRNSDLEQLSAARPALLRARDRRAIERWIATHITPGR